MTPTNEFEDAARTRKVVLLIAALKDANPDLPADRGLVAAALRIANDAFWANLAELAGVNAPSGATRRAVIQVLEAQGQDHRRLEARRVRPGMMSPGQIDDLFAGLT